MLRCYHRRFEHEPVKAVGSHREPVGVRLDNGKDSASKDLRCEKSALRSALHCMGVRTPLRSLGWGRLFENVGNGKTIFHAQGQKEPRREGAMKHHMTFVATVGHGASSGY